ncbi:MAG TPA: aspartate kinase [Alphaproteobacteria bacterium]|nr:aspartate kinase [Alphaproteobacteria bacterium]
MQTPLSGLSVEKIGGTSIAATDVVLKNVLMRPKAEGGYYNRIFVVSAYSGITNKLIDDEKTGEPGIYGMFASTESEWSWSDKISEVGDEMRRINRDIFEDQATRQDADQFIQERIEGVRSCLLDLQRLCSYGHFHLEEHLATVKEMLAALGESHSAFNTTLLLRQRGLNARFVDLTGWREESTPTLDERIGQALEGIDVTSELPILTGYAHCREGLMRTYGRGYTEVTFSRAAVLAKAAEAIIHKEFHLSSADPKIVGLDKVRTIRRTNYDVADQLSNMGMEAVHPRAAKGLRQAEIPLRVKNTFDPNDAGTEISSSYVSEQPCTEIITGLRSVIALEFFEQDMVGVKGYDAAILDTLRRHNVRIVSKCSNANTITHYLKGPLKAVKRVVSGLQEIYPSANITTRNVAIVSMIGSDMDVAGLTARAVNALTDGNIEILGLHQLLRSVDLQMVVEEHAYEDAIRALHKAMVEEAPEGQAVGKAAHPFPQQGENYARNTAAG